MFSVKFLPLGFAFILTAILTWLAVKVFPRWGLLDNPEKYGLKRKPIPYFGGVAVFLGFIISVLIFIPLTKEVIGLLTGVVLLALVSFLDDKRGLPPLLRLSAQILAAGMLVIAGVGISHIANPFGGMLDFTTWDFPIFIGMNEYHITILEDAFTVVWVILLANSLNWFDGVPGLSSGIAGLASLVLFFLAAREGYHYFDQTAVITIAGILAGSAFGFTLFNFPPPKILLGDTGSMLFGFVLAALAIFSGGKVATAALVLGFPLLDAITVIIRRLLQGKSPFHGDYSHLHHRLLAAGLSPRQTVIAIYLAAAAFGSVALFIETAFGKLIALLGLSFVMLAIGWRLRKYQLDGEKE
jgi:UDP-GlcNAc:undecaprenyl-phosphate GlcNAc-1-phosphate transferase